MNIYINQQRLRLFRGARVCDAILRYSEQEYRNVLSRRKQVLNSQGLPINWYNEVADGDCLEISQLAQLTS